MAYAGLTVFIVIFLLLLTVGLRSIYLVRQSFSGIIERLGNFHKKVDSGLHILIPFVDRMLPLIDLKEQLFDFPPQDVITRDNVTMQIDAVIYFQVTDPAKTVYEIGNLRLAFERLAQTNLRNIVGGMTLDETLTARKNINAELREILDTATDKWGCRVHRVEIKSIEPPIDIKQAMEAEVRAERGKRATILTAEGSKQSAILEAEGAKEATIRNGEALKQQAILAAEAEKEKKILEATGQAEAINMIAKATANSIVMIKESGADKAVLTLKSFEALKDLANGQATKIVVPSDLAGLVGTLSSLVETVKENK